MIHYIHDIMYIMIQTTDMIYYYITIFYLHIYIYIYVLYIYIYIYVLYATSKNLSEVNTICISSFRYTHVIIYRKLRLK